jgi:hypothetical protein
MDLKEVVNSISDTMEENASSIFIGLGLVSFGLAVVAACVEAPKAKKIIDETKEELLDANDAYEDSSIDVEEYKEIKKDLYLSAGKGLLRHYGPIALLTASGTFCILNAHDIDNNKIAGLTTALQISETSKKLYKEKVIEKIGQKKEREVQDSVNQEKVKRAKKDDKKVPVLETVKPTTLCFDPYTGRYFRCSVDKIESAVNSVNADMLHNMTQTADLNDFYDYINIPRVKGVPRGWNIDNGCIEFRPTSAVTEDNEPCLVIDFSIEPSYCV